MGSLPETNTVDVDIVAAVERRWDRVVDRLVAELQRRGSPLAVDPVRDFVSRQAHQVWQDTVSLLASQGRANLPRRPDAEAVQMAGRLVADGVHPAEAAMAAGELFQSAMAVLAHASIAPWEPMARCLGSLHTTIHHHLALGYTAWHEAWLEHLHASRSELWQQLQRHMRLVFDAGGAAEFGANVSGNSVGGSLTEREREVLALAARGWTNRRIASALGLAEGTVRRHTSNAYRRLGAAGRVEALVTAHARGWIPLPRS